jgi:hypothetical protein
MNWKIIFQLSVFGLIMAGATISLIPEKVEPVFWLFIFIFSAYIIAKAVDRRHFLHGFCVSLVNCIWITAAHMLFYSAYIANHPSVAKMSAEHAMLPTHPRLEMLIMGPIFGIIFGLILGLFCFIASFIVKKKAAAY